jgi:hypothetical protein
MEHTCFGHVFSQSKIEGRRWKQLARREVRRGEENKDAREGGGRDKGMKKERIEKILV